MLLTFSFACALPAGAANGDSALSVAPKKLTVFEQAEKLVKENHAEAGRALLLNIVKQEPKNARAWYLLGEANQDISIMGKIDSSAKDCYQKALSLDPNYSPGYIKMGELAAIDGNYREQLRYCDRALQCPNPDNFAWKARAIAFSNLNMDKAALDNFKKFMSMPGVSQTDPKVVDLLANLQENAGHYDECMATLDRLEKIQKLMSYKLQRARCLTKTGKAEEAIAIYSKLLSLKGNEDDEVLLSQRAALYSGLGRYQQALADLNHLVEVEPAARAYKQRAALFEKMGEHAKALSDLAKSAAP